MSASDNDVRFAPGSMTPKGDHLFSWQLTPSHLTDPVIIELPPENVLPVIFVPGIMGSNLMSKKKSQDAVWRLDNSAYNHWPITDKPFSLAWSMSTVGPGERQKTLHPALVEVDPRGAVPKRAAGSVYDPKQYTERGWGEVGEGSYSSFLLWLEQVLNGQGYNPAKWPQFSYVAASALPVPGKQAPELPLGPGINMSLRGLPEQGEKGPPTLLSDDLIARARFRMPVYACGYNWLDSNTTAADELKKRIRKVIDENNHAPSRCSQVILVTHSMGGLVARACQQLEGMQDTIAGVAHGVMPSVGAAVAYRRCKVGMQDENALAGMVVGSTGQEVTAVFAQAPGALQLLPSRQYRAGWLSIDSPSGKSLETEPNTGDPYTDIYLRQDRWWGLINMEWLSPPDGIPLRWDLYRQNILWASKFHHDVENAYHPNTYVFYGKDTGQPSFEGVHWQVKPAPLYNQSTAPSPDKLANLGSGEIRDDGSNPLLVVDPLGYGSNKGISKEIAYNAAFWRLECAKQDGGGDGTVPSSSGTYPLHSGGAAIQQQFGLTGFDHEGAYRNDGARIVTLYALHKIAAKARVPT
jgi:pimeloyl-ACP methyl ester carboxylesterase